MGEGGSVSGGKWGLGWGGRGRVQGGDGGGGQCVRGGRRCQAAHRSAARRVEVLSTMRSMPKTRTIGALCCVSAVAAAAESSSLVGSLPTLREIWGDVGEIWARYGRDVGEMWARCGRDVGEIWARYGRDMGEMWARYRRDMREI